MTISGAAAVRRTRNAEQVGEIDAERGRDRCVALDGRQVRAALDLRLVRRVDAGLILDVGEGQPTTAAQLADAASHALGKGRSR